MRYTDLEGQTATGTVWAPGPVANSVWVIEDGHCPREPGSAVVVKLPKGKVDGAQEINRWGHPAHEHDDGRSCSDAMCLYGLSWPLRDHVIRRGYRYAPKLSEKVWRAAVGDQCTQLTLGDTAVSA